HPEHHQAAAAGAPAAASAGPVNHTVLAMRDKVRDMMRFAWTSYERYAWGMNELRPSANRRPIVDAVDTLYMNEFARRVSVFEMNIRFIGGLLSVYYMSGDRLFVDKAVQLADPVTAGIQYAHWHSLRFGEFETKVGKNYNWAAGSCSILSEIGTLHMEFAALSEITASMLDKVLKIRSILAKANKPNGLYPNYIHPSTASWLGDSFYEYLIKRVAPFGQSGCRSKQLFDESLPGIERHMLRTSDFSSAALLGRRKIRSHSGEEDGSFGLLCRRVMFALGAHETRQSAASSSTSNRSLINGFKLGRRITATCRESYERTAVKLGPESFRFDSGVEAVAVRVPEKVMLMMGLQGTPLVIKQSVNRGKLFLHVAINARTIKNIATGPGMLCAHLKPTAGPKPAIQACGMCTLLPSPGKDDVQQSYFLAETLKYLYLIFSA
uniref:alpha-1,2-Mannosidase n=1 Tax=Macrostomum lignano TaxID=282301 RepID=A0A1I8FC30_9PLAT